MKSYQINCDISEPVLLNCWKHHAGFIKSKIIEYKNTPGLHRNNLRNELLLIGESVMDLYLGELTPADIADSIITYCHKQGIYDRSGFYSWLKEERGEYGFIELADKSRWTLRLGDKIERYIHIHPSRYSHQTIRVRSSSLKSAILFLILEKPAYPDKLLFINRIRKDYFNLPPLKNLDSSVYLTRLIDILSSY